MCKLSCNNKIRISKMSKLCIKIHDSVSTLYCPTNAHNIKKSIVVKIYLKIRKLLHYVSVYKETIIREPEPVLS